MNQRTGLAPPWLVSLLVAALAGLPGCAINPATGTPDLVFMSENRELELGRELHTQLLESAPVYDNEALQAYVDEIGQRLVQNSHRPDLTYTFTLIDSPDSNAFALPGGYIYLHRGLLTYLQSEAQLAAVLAHEIAHITGRHAVKQDAARKGSGAVTVLSVVATGSGAVGEATNLWSTAAVKGYGRDMELEADSLGAEYLYESGYNPGAMLEVIGVLKDQERYARRMARESGRQMASYHGVFATHPRHDQRLQEVVGKAGDLSRQQAGNQRDTDGRQRFRQMTEGLPVAGGGQLRYVIANERTTFARLAQHVQSQGHRARYTEQQLRLMNDYYPHGEPQPGEWIKIVQ